MDGSAINKLPFSGLVIALSAFNTTKSIVFFLNKQHKALKIKVKKSLLNEQALYFKQKMS